MKLKYTIAAILATSTAHAGGLSGPISEPRPVARPTVGTPVTVRDWSGPFVRLSFGRQSVDRDVEVVTESVEQVKQIEPVTETCEYDESKGQHYGRKCRDLGQYAVSEDLNALPYGNWKGCEAAVCAWGYDEAGNVTDIWLENFEPFTFDTGLSAFTYVEQVTSSIDYVTENFDESALGLSIGQRWQEGNVVYGGELTAMRNLDAETNMFTGEGTMGYSLGSALPYLSAGFAITDDESAAIYGAGVDFAVTDSLFVGAEYFKADALDTDTFALSVGIWF